MMKRLLVGALLFACFQSQGLAQQQIAGIPDVDARKVLDRLKWEDSVGMFRPRQARKPIVPRTGQDSRAMEVRNTGSVKPAFSGGSELPRQVEEKQEGEFFRLLVPKPQAQVVQPEVASVARSSPIRAYRKPSLPPPMVRYFPAEPQPHVPEPSLYLEDGSLSRTFCRPIEHHPLMIEVKLGKNEALSYYSGEGEKIQFGRIEDVPLDGILYFYEEGRKQVFLRFGGMCGLDGSREVALCYRSRQLEVTVKRARIVTLDVPAPKKSK